MVSSEVISEAVYSMRTCDAMFHTCSYFLYLPLEACGAGTSCLPTARGARQLLQGRCAGGRGEHRLSPNHCPGQGGRGLRLTVKCRSRCLQHISCICLPLENLKLV